MNSKTTKINIEAVEKCLFEMQSKKIPDITPGDIVIVSEKIIDEKKTRIQKFEGIVLVNTGTLLKRNILIRKKFQNFWIEKRFFLHSPLIEEIVIVSKGNPRRAFLTYLRNSKNLAQKLKRLKK